MLNSCCALFPHLEPRLFSGVTGSITPLVMEDGRHTKRLKDLDAKSLHCTITFWSLFFRCTICSIRINCLDRRFFVFRVISESCFLSASKMWLEPQKLQETSHQIQDVFRVGMLTCKRPPRRLCRFCWASEPNQRI